MDLIEKEELVGLLVLLVVIISLDLCNKLTPTALDGIKWIGAAFMGSKGIQGLFPASKKPDKE